MTDFTDPDFAYALSSFTKNFNSFTKDVYMLRIEPHENESNRDQRKLRRIELKLDGCVRGIAQQPAI